MAYWKAPFLLVIFHVLSEHTPPKGRPSLPKIVRIVLQFGVKTTHNNFLRFGARTQRRTTIQTALNSWDSSDSNDACIFHVAFDTSLGNPLEYLESRKNRGTESKKMFRSKSRGQIIAARSFVELSPHRKHIWKALSKTVPMHYWLGKCDIPFQSYGYFVQWFIQCVRYVHWSIVRVYSSLPRRDGVCITIKLVINPETINYHFSSTHDALAALGAASGPWSIEGWWRPYWCGKLGLQSSPTRTVNFLLFFIKLCWDLHFILLL